MPTSALATASFTRMWRAFLSGRMLVAAVLVLLLALQAWSQNGLPRQAPLTWGIGGAYLALTVLTWALGRERPPPRRISLLWLLVAGTDVAAVALLQVLQPGGINYTPLLALPVLMTAVLGGLRLALATTASITLLLLGWAAWNGWQALPGASESYLQTALTCAGYFLVAYLSHLLAQRLAREEVRARHSRQQAASQALVNRLIIEHLDEGILVLDARQHIQMANPAARQLLGKDALLQRHPTLEGLPAWAPLRTLVDQTFAQHQAQLAHVQLLHPGESPLGLYVRTWLSSPPAPTSEDDLPPPAPLCVMFLHDLREIEARLRTEKLAAMGRMSAAVAHEIRNPLAAIVQANALLAEDLQDPGQQRLSRMVEQNAERLAHIAEEVLDIARVQHQIHHAQAAALVLDEQLAALWHEWCAHDPAARRGVFDADCPGVAVAFEAEHLRRVVFNLLDNALRHIPAQADALQLVTGHQGDGQQPPQSWLQVWSEGPALDASVQRHLFEPFFSSQSRSTGLGLYICRELCQRYGASLHYQRLSRPTARGLQPGNAFTVVFRPGSLPPAHASLFDTVVV